MTHASDDLAAAYTGLRLAFDRDGGVPVADRRAALTALRGSLVNDAEAYAAAIAADFGGRSRHETLLTEVALLIQGVDYTMPRLAAWAANRRVRLGWPFWPASGEIEPCPRGVAGIIGPSNYPLQLALMPLIGALAAGCRVLIKPSDLTPRAATLMQTSLSKALDATVARVVLGGPAVSAALTQLPLDMLFFTGSQTVGRMVSTAAAENLTPVVLELGGKSPVFIDPDADLSAAALSIVAGKLLNAGQTCVAPDYVLVPKARLDAFVQTARDAARRLYPDAADYSAILSAGGASRLAALEQGLDVIPLSPSPVTPPFYRPALVRAPPLDAAIMREEIFGPLLPIVPYDTLDGAAAIVRARPTPLVVYWFGQDDARRRSVLKTVPSGTVSVNETVIHAGIQALPFGGLGGSGLGRYHGKAGFDAFTHRRAVFRQARWSVTTMMRPPYGKTADGILARLLR